MTLLTVRNKNTHMPVNPVTDVTPVLLATLYAMENLQGELPVCRQILTHCEKGEFDTVKTLCDEFTRPEFRASLDYLRRKQFTAFVTKVPFRGSDGDRRARALSSFDKSEAKCRRSNKRLRYFKAHLWRLPEHYQHIIAEIRKEIKFLLGDLTDRALEEILKEARPGPGLSIGTRDNRFVSLPWKLGKTDFVCTPDALPYVRRMFNLNETWSSAFLHPEFQKIGPRQVRARRDIPVEVVNCSKITFVPKDARTLRTIAIEPSMNVMLQLGVHEYLSRRLTRLGNCIKDQSRNQNLARFGSELWEDPTSSMATIDLKAASDTISLGLCELLLPEDWLALFLDLRSPQGQVKRGKQNSITTFEKISSMGNGYTFVLETIIFLAIARACNRYAGGGSCKPSAYGDDIIVPCGSYAVTVELLKFLGFETNVDKTFALGPFRESCGADWHRGLNVTPVYLRTDRLLVTDVYSLRNQLTQKPGGVTVLEKYLKQRVRLVTKVLYGLPGKDTTGCWFIDPSDLRAFVRRKVIRWEHQIQNYNWKVIRWVEKRYSCSPWMSYLAKLKGLGATEHSDPSRDAFEDPKTYESRKRAGAYRHSYVVRVPSGRGSVG